MERSPHAIAIEIVEMSTHYARASELYANYKKIEADFFHKERDNYKSDNATEKAFARTEDGVVMAQLKVKIKSLASKMSANKALLRVLEAEARNTM